MPVAHLRSPSVDATSAPSPPTKRLKTAHNANSKSSASAQFSDGLLDAHSVQSLNASYQASEPYKHAVVDKLFQDRLLTKVKDECLGELSFTEKETDIYKVNQTGDLASLSYLPESQIALLPNLLTLRDALYSPEFRAFIRAVTGCGALSGTKADMSVNTYTKGCHLLNHDDVIGTRRVSYILYMPLPKSQAWQKEWGGALELYPVKYGPEGIAEPENIPSKIIPPSWDQFIFFEVQPGKSFHSVEEVVVDDGGCERQRLSISGWFHAAQEGEEGYEAEVSEDEEKLKSSLEQLTSASPITFASYPSPSLPPSIGSPLLAEHTSFLSNFLNPVYLQFKTLQALALRFVEESSLELHDLLCEPLAEKLASGLRERDVRDGLDGASRSGRIPQHSAGIGNETGWELRGPPHKARYCVLSASAAVSPITESTPYAAGSATVDLLRSLQDSLFPSAAFRAWLALVSSLVPMRYSAEARRFRPGLDYTLATSEETESRLDVVLGLTPAVDVPEHKATPGTGKGKGKEKGKEVEEDEEEDELPFSWESGEWGGWECYMAPHEGDDDPAVYRSGPSKPKAASSEKLEDGDSIKIGSHTIEAGASNGTGADDVELVEPQREDDGEEGEEEDEEEEEAEDGTLLTVQPGFNRLLLVLRDEGVMRFVKYVSAAADGSRWDICGEYEVGMLEEVDGE